MSVASMNSFLCFLFHFCQPRLLEGSHIAEQNSKFVYKDFFSPICKKANKSKHNFTGILSIIILSRREFKRYINSGYPLYKTSTKTPTFSIYTA